MNASAVKAATAESSAVAGTVRSREVERSKAGDSACRLARCARDSPFVSAHRAIRPLHAGRLRAMLCAARPVASTGQRQVDAVEGDSQERASPKTQDDLSAREDIHPARASPRRRTRAGDLSSLRRDDQHGSHPRTRWACRRHAREAFRERSLLRRDRDHRATRQRPDPRRVRPDRCRQYSPGQDDRSDPGRGRARAGCPARAGCSAHAGCSAPDATAAASTPPSDAGPAPSA